MRQREALKLHRGDEVTVKESGVVAMVLSVSRIGRVALLELASTSGWHGQMPHFEVR